ncbi:MAG: hypothetical protein ACOY4I_06365 [Bacillota bacterium]
MVEAVKVLPLEIQESIKVQIWNIKELAGIEKKAQLRARCVPSLAIDGEVVFESTIPTQDDLIAAVRKRRYT